MSLPQHMRADDPAAADPARRRLLQKSPFPRLPSLPSRPSSLPSLPLLFAAPSTDDIHIDHFPLPLPQDKGLYRWAVLYENQRGITLFSAPYYSALSLLPTDPPPFTAPHTRDTRGAHSTLSLDNYPLPDGTWRWVSSAWMIDMRTHLGDVQHDGFEYNWSFRDRHWHAQIGKFSAGAWVRRRRWVRLMMRPASHTNGYSSPTLVSYGNSLPTLRPASNLFLSDMDHDAFHVWDGSEQDWQHVHRLLRQLGRDGRKLELWRVWLAPYAQTPPSNPKGKARQSDAPPLPSHSALEKRLTNVTPRGPAPPLEHLTTILENHGEAILQSFVFPDSRAQFISLVRQAELAKALASYLERDFSAADLDFWSYAKNEDEGLD